MLRPDYVVLYCHNTAKPETESLFHDMVPVTRIVLWICWSYEIVEVEEGSPFVWAIPLCEFDKIVACFLNYLQILFVRIET